MAPRPQAGSCMGSSDERRETVPVMPAERDRSERAPGPRHLGPRHFQMQTYYVYVLASRRNGTLYHGVTNALVRRFTQRYRVKRLVYFEAHDSIDEAILREKRLKRWRRQWKLELIEQANPQWRDLWDEIAPGSRLSPGYPAGLGRDDKKRRGL